MHSAENRTVERLRAAVRCGAWSEVEELLGVLQREAEESWHRASSADERAAIRDEVFGLLEWTRNMALAGRAHAQSSLTRLSRQGAYLAN